MHLRAWAILDPSSDFFCVRSGNKTLRAVKQVGRERRFSVAKDFDLHSNDQGKNCQRPPGRRVIPFDSVRRGRHDFLPIATEKAEPRAEAGGLTAGIPATAVGGRRPHIPAGDRYRLWALCPHNVQGVHCVKSKVRGTTPAGPNLSAIFTRAIPVKTIFQTAGRYSACRGFDYARARSQCGLELTWIRGSALPSGEI